MNPKQMFGIIALVAGVALMIYGMNASHSMADQMSNTFRGRFTDNTNWYIYGGIALGLCGLLMVVMRGKTA
jgi:hypothetical protein